MGNLEYQYRVSVIVPIFNAEDYLETCFNSLLQQTIDLNDVEVLMINDGSTDQSEFICKQYSELYGNFKLFSKENEGLSATRNFGLMNAQGKYICYLDADDTFSPETLKNLCDFFDLHYDEVDEITFPINRYAHGKSFAPHYRYKYLLNTGIYDLKEYPFISQTTINVCVKNLFENNILFDTTKNFRHEDQKYNNMILFEKMRIGFVKEAEYRYNRDNENSIVSTSMYPYYIFDTTMNYYENLFSKFEKNVPHYFQAMFMHDLNWKLMSDKLFPFHYGQEQFEIAICRIKNLLAQCDPEIIINHPTINHFHVQYWLNLKPNVFPAIVAEDKEFSIRVNAKDIYKRNFFEIIMHKIRVQNGELRMLAFVKSPIYNYIDEPCNLYVVENGTTRKKIEVFTSSHSYYKTHFTQTNNFYAYNYKCDVNKVFNYYFEVELDGFVYETKYWCMPTAVFDLQRGVNQYIRENVLLTLKENVINLQKIDLETCFDYEHQFNEKYRTNLKIYNLRENCLRYRKIHKVWLYYDSNTTQLDNGFYQFQNDFKHCQEDGIERWYVIFDDGEKNTFTDEQKRYLVKFGSEMHKLLYLSCERIFTAYFGWSTISPFSNEAEEKNYSDLIKSKTIYLQHGVLHAALRTYNDVEKCRAEQIVVSSSFEINNYINNYHYSREDLIPTGMARYDFINRSQPAKNRILYAPSWRKYLTFSPKFSEWVVSREQMLESEYFINMLDFLNNPELDRILNDNDLYLDVKLHPIIKKSQIKFFELTSRRIQIVDDASVEDYKIFITDFSSYVFDYACLGRPIIYYVTDYEQFKSGMNHYKELDLDFSEGFGPLCMTPKETIREINNIITNDFIVQEPYKNRLSNFFFSINNCCERLYQYVIDVDAKTANLL